MRKHLRRNVDMKRRSVNARGKGNGSLANECLQWPIWIRLSWIFRLLLHLERTYTNGIPGHIFMDFSTLHAYHCSPHTYFQTGHRTRLSGIIPHFHVFSSYECSSQLCTRFSSVLYNTHRFSLPLCVGLSLWSCWWIQRSGLLSFSPWTSPFLVWSSLTITLFCVPFFQMTYLHAPQHCSLSLCTLSLTSSHWSSQVSIQPLWRVVKPFPFSFLFPVVFLPFFTHIYLNILYLFYLLSRCYLCIASIISPLKIH